MKNKTRKIMAVICLILVLLTSLPIQTFATFITDMNSNAQFGVVPGSKEGYGHELHYANYDGAQYLVFCTHYGMNSANGSEYTYNGDFIVHQKASAPDYEKIAEMIYFGYTMNYGMGLPGSDDAIRAACCTQQYVWEYIHDHIDPAQRVPDRESWNGNYMSTGHLAEWTARTESYYNQYHGNVSFNGTSNKVVLGDTTTISDANGRLASYKTFNQTIDGQEFCTGDYIPFHFYARMPMLFNIQKGYGVKPVNAEDIVYLIVSIDAIINEPSREYIFSDAHAISKIAKFYGPQHITEIDHLLDIVQFHF